MLKTCQRLGIQTVAVHSDVDAGLPLLGGQTKRLSSAAPVAQSYLNADLIIELAKRSGAQAIHPGYGLLSENAGVTAQDRGSRVGLYWTDAREHRRDGLEGCCAPYRTGCGAAVGAGGRPRSPRWRGGVREAERIGYPLLVKASAGGGGIGMARVRPARLERALLEAIDKGNRFFGDGTVFIEKLIEEPHHVEVQVLGDGRGHVVHLGDRECSMQRRHQSFWRRRRATCSMSGNASLCAQAVALAEADRYRARDRRVYAADASGVYFLEMNTRLQVEHPVGELHAST